VIQITLSRIEFSDNPSILLRYLVSCLGIGTSAQKRTNSRRANQSRKLSNDVGVAMNAVSVLRTRTINSKACDRASQKQDDAERECRPISLLSVLEAENIRLRQAVVQLLIDTLALREALHGGEASTSWRSVQPTRSGSVVQLLRAHDVALTAVARGRVGAVVADV
jgi:hypothetical protein